MSSNTSGQATFGDDGSIDNPETLDTDLSAYGVEREPERETRRDEPEATAFGVDDRPLDDSAIDAVRQETLVTDAEQTTIEAETEAKPKLGDVYGATMKTPIPDAERNDVRTDGAPIDSRELASTPLEPRDFARRGVEVELEHDRADLEDRRRTGENPTDQAHYVATGTIRVSPERPGDDICEPAECWDVKADGYVAYGSGARITAERVRVGCFEVILKGGNGVSHTVAENLRYHNAETLKNQLSNHVTPDDIREGGDRLADAIDSIDEATIEDYEADEKQPVTDGGQVTSIDEIADEPVRLITGITGVMHSPDIVDGEASSSGKTIAVEHHDTTHRLDTETILAGDSEFRDSRYFEIYTPERLQNKQRSNHAPGPQAGASKISDIDTLPEPTHRPADEPAETTDETAHESPEESEGSGTTTDTWDLSQYGRGSVLILEKYAGEFLVVDHKRTQFGDVTALHVIDSDGEPLRLKKTDVGGDGYLFDVRRCEVDGGRFRPVSTQAFRRVDDIDDVREFEKVGEDTQRLRQWIRSMSHGAGGV